MMFFWASPSLHVHNFAEIPHALCNWLFWLMTLSPIRCCLINSPIIQHEHHPVTHQRKITSTCLVFFQRPPAFYAHSIYVHKTYSIQHTLSSHLPNTPRCSSVANAGVRAFCHELDIGRVHNTGDIFNFSHFCLPILEKRRFLCFYIIKSIARKGYFGPKYP